MPSSYSVGYHFEPIDIKWNFWDIIAAFTTELGVEAREALIVEIRLYSYHSADESRRLDCLWKQVDYYFH